MLAKARNNPPALPHPAPAPRLAPAPLALALRVQSQDSTRLVFAPLRGAGEGLCRHDDSPNGSTSVHKDDTERAEKDCRCVQQRRFSPSPVYSFVMQADIAPFRGMLLGLFFALCLDFGKAERSLKGQQVTGIMPAACHVHAQSD